MYWYASLSSMEPIVQIDVYNQLPEKISSIQGALDPKIRQSNMSSIE